MRFSGGIVYNYDAEKGIFVHAELSQIHYNRRVQVLAQKLVELGSRELSAEEMHSIIYRGAFIFEGYRYEYNASTGLYEQTSISNEEYEWRLQQLQQQLHTIGYEHMTLVECNSTIYNGAFYYNGYDYVYNYDKNEYDRADVETSSQHRADETEYSRVTTEQAVVTTERIYVEPTEPGQRVKPTVGPGRGDQPPETYVAEYEDEEGTVEQEPGVGYYPVPAEPPIPTTHVLQTADTVDERSAAIQLEQQAQEEEQRIRVYEEQRLEHDQRVREQLEQREAENERLRLQQEEQRRLNDEEVRAQSEQRRLQDEQRQQEELDRQRAERRAADEAQLLEEQRRSEELRQEEERLVREDLERRQKEADRKELERRENEERQRLEDEEGDGDQEEGDYEEEEDVEEE